MPRHTTKIFGPPGTGKTTRLMALLDREIARGTPGDRIAFLTHTNAAADVAASRCAKGVDRRWFRTIHSACVKRLGIPRESIVDPTDYRDFSRATGLKLLSERADGLVEDWLRHASDNYAPALRAYDLSRLSGRPLADICAEMPTHPSLTAIRRATFVGEWESYKEAHGLFDFTDMLRRYVDSEIGPIPCDAVFLDEGQDLSHLQWLVFNKFITDAERVYVAGDDDQGIYGFMGGSEFGFLDFPADVDEVLRESWRVPQAIGERAMRVIRRVERRREKDIVWKQAEGNLIRVNLGPLHLPWSNWRAGGKSVLVLARHRRGARDVSDALTSIACPHALGNFSLHNSAEAKIVRDYIIVRKGGKVPWRRMMKLLIAAGADDRADEVRTAGTAKRDTECGAEITFDWTDDEWPLLFGRSRESLKRIRQIERIIQQEGIEVVGREPQIAVMTMHAAKGREADIVVLIPDCNEIVQKNLQKPTEIRLAYVALTRAKERVVVLSPRSPRWITHLTGA